MVRAVCLPHVIEGDRPVEIRVFGEMMEVAWPANSPLLLLP